ncbi:MAG: hypothetical protein LBR44_03750 [Clostridiales Family XIII bacterium]|nr:hypothetical protein [Clostridiales Family XIII bacterium]
MDEVNREIEAKVSEMESPSYEFPKRFSRKDYIIAAAVVGVSLALVIAGGFLG